jgi:Protein of unknown function (DUF3040)
MVSLPARQQRALDRIEIGLESCDPRLKSMFAIFTRLTRGEEVPCTERVRGPRSPRPRRRTGVRGMITVAPIVVVMLLGIVTLCVFLASNSPGTGCRSVSRQRAAALPALSSARACQPVPQTWK